MFRKETLYVKQPKEAQQGKDGKNMSEFTNKIDFEVLVMVQNARLTLQWYSA